MNVSSLFNSSVSIHFILRPGSISAPNSQGRAFRPARKNLPADYNRRTAANLLLMKLTIKLSKKQGNFP